MAQYEIDPWDDTIPRELKGIGGWLLLPLLQLVATPLLIIASLSGRLKAHPPAAAFHAMAGHPLFLALTSVVFVLMLAQLLFGLFCLVQLFRKKAKLPRLMTIWYGLGIAASIFAAIQFALDPDMFGKVVDATATSGGLKLSTTLLLLWNGFFIVYFDVSKRVKNTFVR